VSIIFTLKVHDEKFPLPSFAIKVTGNVPTPISNVSTEGLWISEINEAQLSDVSAKFL